MILISIIVPVYKVEPYLRKCLDSIVNQTYKDLEILLIDDCSPDNCGKICDEYAKRDNRIRVFHLLQNGGLSSARNKGLNEANGEYIGFVDSDDWIEYNMYEVLLGRVSNHVWNKLYQRKVFVGLSFHEGHNYEDISIMHKLMSKAQLVTAFEMPLFHYRQREDSITKNVHGTKPYRLCRCIS